MSLFPFSQFYLKNVGIILGAPFPIYTIICQDHIQGNGSVMSHRHLDKLRWTSHHDKHITPPKKGTPPPQKKRTWQCKKTAIIFNGRIHLHGWNFPASHVGVLPWGWSPQSSRVRVQNFTMEISSWGDSLIPCFSGDRQGCTPIPTYPYGKSLYKPYIVSIYGYLWVIIPKNPKVEHNKYHGYTARATPNCPLSFGFVKPPFINLLNWHVPGITWIFLP